MLTDNEKSFIEYWEKNRLKEKSPFRMLFPGLPAGLLIGVSILFILNAGWYERADMVAATQSSPYVLLICIASITVFTSFFYKRFRWDMNEQRYLELKQKHEKENKEQQAAIDN